MPLDAIQLPYMVGGRTGSSLRLGEESRAVGGGRPMGVGGGYGVSADPLEEVPCGQEPQGYESGRGIGSCEGNKGTGIADSVK